MRNVLSVEVSVPVGVLFDFCVKPPNTTLWIPGVIKEEIDTEIIDVGTNYELTKDTGESFVVKVTEYVLDELIEWVSEDNNFHCKYEFTSIDENASKLKYTEWVDTGVLDEPFSESILLKMKSVIETQQIY